MCRGICSAGFRVEGQGLSGRVDVFNIRVPGKDVSRKGYC
jgi:hypothetical protein